MTLKIIIRENLVIIECSLLWHKAEVGEWLLSVQGRLIEANI